VSTDPLDSPPRVRTKARAAFLLASDEAGDIARRRVPLKNGPRDAASASLIGADGRIKRTFPQVNAQGSRRPSCCKPSRAETSGRVWLRGHLLDHKID